MSNLIQYIVQDDPEEELKKKQSQTLLSRELPSRQNTDKNYKFSSRHLLENSFNSLPSNKFAQNKEESYFMSRISDSFNKIEFDKKSSSVNIKSQDLKISNKTENQTPTPWAKSAPKIDIKQEIKNPPVSINGNEMSAKDRIDALKSGKKIYINIADNPNAKSDLLPEHLHNWGKDYVDKYSKQIEKYSRQYGVDPDMVKAILYSENSDYHKYGYNKLADIIKISESTLPMNIQGKTWGNFQGKQYDVNDPEQNIELSVRVLKSMYDAVPDKDIAKIATLWNGTGLKEVNDYGARAKEYYKNKTWNNPLEMPEF